MKTFRGNTSWLALIGAGFFWGWLDCLVAQGTLFDPFGSLDLVGEAYLLTYAVSALPALVALLLPLRIDRLTTHPAVGPAIGLVGTIGCVLIAGGGASSSIAVFWTGVVLAGFALGGLLIFWGRVCVCQGSTHAFVHITGAYAVSLLIDLFVLCFRPFPAAAFLALCPLISGALFWILARYTDDGKELALGSAHTYGELGDDVSPDASVRFEAKLVAIILSFYCVLGFANFVNNPSSMGTMGSQIYGMAWEVAGVLLFCLVAFLGWRARKVSLFGIVMLGLAAVAAFLPLSTEFVHIASGSFMSAGCIAFDIICWSLVALMHHFTRRPYVQTVAIVALCQQVGSFIGYAAGVLFPQAETNLSLYAPLVVFLCAVLAVGILYTRRSNKKLLAALFSDESVDDLPEAPDHTALPGGAMLSLVPTAADLQAAEKALETGNVVEMEAERAFAVLNAGSTLREHNVVGSCAHADLAGASHHAAASISKSASPAKSTAHASIASSAEGNLAPSVGNAPSGQTDPHSPVTTSAQSEQTALEATIIERLSDEFHLTRREREVFAHLAKGRSAPYIAEVYQVSENTVRSHIKHIYTKLDVHSRQELLSFIQDASQE